MDLRDVVTASTDLLAYGEPTHLEPAFGRIRNELFADLAEHGFRSIALETDRVAALAVDDFVREGIGTLENVMRDGFSHTFGALDTNRQLVAWMREYNKSRPPAERLACHGFDAPTEMTSAPSPRRYLERARDYLGLDTDLATLAGDDERWSRTEAVMDPAMSVGATADADRLRVLADDMLTVLHARAPELMATTSRAAWDRARTHLTAGIGLLRYHRQAAERVDEATRISRLSAVRDVIMARNLLDIRQFEDGRGPTLVFSQNRHLQRNRSHMSFGPMDIVWFSAGAIVASLLGERYTFVAGSLGRSAAIGLGEPEADTYEAALRQRVDGWGLVAPAGVAPARVRTDTTPLQGYFPLDREIMESADAVLHVVEGDPVRATAPRSPA
ncbi:erythromycin esterase family protein [Actinophytocola sp. NPDC049390]|uniref:erythromycin esterase family protein n=1 Tax=Actinophytocola sp. NPDC049390 TaxID=3363894 RepID=UPI0037A42A6C